jgi:hypothetical protein
VYSPMIDATYMVTLTAFISFVQAQATGNAVMVIQSTKDGGVTWGKHMSITFDAIAGDGTIKLKAANALYELPAKSDDYCLPINTFGFGLVRFGFAMQNANDPQGSISFEYGVQLRTPP